MKLLNHLMIIAAAVAACQSAAAQKAPYKLEVGDFSELKVTDGINVEYYCSTDSAGMAYFECEPAIAQMLMFTNKKNSLNIQIATDGATISELPTIRVYSMTLHKVENAGDSTVYVRRALPVRDFSATIVGNGNLIATDLRAHKVSGAIKTGSGHLVLTGTTREANLRNVGTGALEASGLKAEDTKCHVLGTGTIDCNAEIALAVAGAGSGKVYYGGTPKKLSNRSLGIKAISMDTNQEIE